MTKTIKRIDLSTVELFEVGVIGSETRGLLVYR